MEYEPGTYILHISRTPLMMIVGLNDHLTVADVALAAYEGALAPKCLVTLPGGHFDACSRTLPLRPARQVEWLVQAFTVKTPSVR